ncbi:hypothetical protein ACHMXB_22685 (plasmid) [Arthrobacter sp. UC242_113]|uniref:hypothetical protein n=1 Tax=Arthrobacter sp. UC242_113 TaxID=3374550 RepID=UPI0037572806
MGPTGYHVQGASKPMFRDSFVAIADAGNPLLQQQLTLADLATMPHAVGYFGEGISTPADKLFESRGVQRRVAAVVAGLASLVEAMYWHPSQTEDPASVWLRSVVQRSCGRLHGLFPVTAHPVTVESTKE